MVKSTSEDDRQRLVLLTSIVTSIVLVIFFLLGAISTNVTRGGVAYTQVDMIAGSIFVLVLTTVLHQLNQKIIYPHYDFKHLTEKYFEIGMKLDDFLIQLVKYCTMIISLSLWPKVLDWLDKRKKNKEVSR